MPPVSTVGSAFGHKFFSPKTDATASALPSLGKNFDPINKHGAFKLPLAAGRVTPTWLIVISIFCLCCEHRSTELRLERLTGIKQPVYSSSSEIMKSFILIVALLSPLSLQAQTE